MKILHVLAQMPAKTGSGVYYSNVISRLSEHGHTQRAVYAFQGQDSFDLLPKSHRHAVGFQTEELPFPIAGMSDVMPYESTKYAQMDEAQLNTWLAAFRRRLEEAKEEFCPDAVILHHLWILTSLGAEVYEGAVTIGVCHNTDLRQAMQNPAMKKKHVRHLGKLSAIFSLSDAQRPVISQLYEYDIEKIITMGGAYDEKIFYPSPEKPPFDGTVKLVYAAKIAPSKGIYSLLQAFKIAQLQEPGLELDIIGTPHAENVQRLASAVAGQKGIQLYNAMPQEELAAHLRKKDVFLMPSFYEGIALMALESLACGLRVVVSQIEALHEMLSDEVNHSGVIEYVKLPRLSGVDTPHLEDLPEFEERLADALLLQARRVRQGLPFPPEAVKSIAQHSWHNLAQHIDTVLTVLHNGYKLPQQGDKPLDC